MLLVVLTTVMISFIAVFAQLLTVQTAKMYNSENALAQNMITWHSAAANLAHTNPPVFTTAGCLLSPVAAAAIAGPCATMLSTTTLPPGYTAANSTFYSVAFSTGISGFSAGNYVLTFVYATDANGFLILPGGAGSVSAGITLGELSAQLQRAAPPEAEFGTVISNAGGPVFKQLVPGANGSINQIYTVPATIPVGAIGIISPGN